MKIAKLLLIASAFLTLSAFSTQPLDERKAQDTLPKSQDPMWKTLGKAKVSIDQKHGNYSAAIPPEVKALAGRQVTIKGFILPLESTEKFKHFLIAKRTPTCPFCPPGEPNEIVDVWTDGAIPYTENLVTVKGVFKLMNDKEMGLFFQLKNAKEL